MEFFSVRRITQEVIDETLYSFAVSMGRTDLITPCTHDMHSRGEVLASIYVCTLRLLLLAGT